MNLTVREMYSHSLFLSFLMQPPVTLVFWRMRRALLMPLLIAGIAFCIETTAHAQPAPPALKDDAATQILDKLHAISIPRLDFSNVSLQEAIDFLSNRARDLDVNEKNPATRGFNFVIRKTRAANDAEIRKEAIISELQLSRVSAAATLYYICELTNHRFVIEDGIIVISPRAGASQRPFLIERPEEKVQLEKRLSELIIPRIDFENVSLEEAIAFLRNKCVEMSPETKRINFVIACSMTNKIPRIDKLQLNNATLASVLKHFCDATHLRYTVDGTSVIILPQKM